MNARGYALSAGALAVMVAFGVSFADTRRVRNKETFNAVGHLKLPATKMPNDYHHLHVSETGGERLLTVVDSFNRLTIVDVSDRTNPVLARQVQLTAVGPHCDPLLLVGGVALVAETGKPELPGPQTIDIVGISKDHTPIVTGRFENVTGFEADQMSIYLISGNDLYILGGHDVLADEWKSTLGK
jgi:hypothetical protein